jgi:aspartyl/glutamyl-tRNA(Asn/Gln) amidotransferase C subunit
VVPASRLAGTLSRTPGRTACRRSPATRWRTWPASSRLALEDDELDRLAGQLDVILGAVAKIGEVTDAADVPPTTHAVPIENVYRPDVVTPSLPRDAVLAGAPRPRTAASACRASWTTSMSEPRRP